MYKLGGHKIDNDNALLTSVLTAVTVAAAVTAGVVAVGVVVAAVESTVGVAEEGAAAVDRFWLEEEEGEPLLSLTWPFTCEELLKIMQKFICNCK